MKEAIDTTKLCDSSTGKGTLILYVLATDSFGNKKLDTRTAEIDQELARPTITIGGIDLGSSMTSANPILYASQILYSCSITAATGCSIENAYYGYSKSNITNPIANPSSFNIQNIPEGNTNIYFKIEYKSGEKYISSESYSINSPRLTDNSNNKYGYKPTEPNYRGASSVIYMKVDVTPPTIEKLYYDGTTEWKEFDTPSFGGTKRPDIDFKIKLSDANGIKSATAKLGSNGETTLTRDGTDSYLFTGNFTTKDFSNGSNRITFKVTDKAGLVTNASYSLYIDNKGPEIIINNSSSTQPVSGTHTVSGRTENNIGANDSTTDLYFMVKPLDTSKTLNWGDATAHSLTGTAPEKPQKDDTAWIPYRSSSSELSTIAWQLVFDGTGIDTGAYKSVDLLNNYIISLYANAYGTRNGLTLGEAIASRDILTQYSLLTPLYIFFKAVDSMGNVTISDNNFYLNVDPQGDRPTVTIISPSNKMSTGGVIRMYGSAFEKNQGIEAVYVQLDPSLDVPGDNASNVDMTKFSSDWYDKVVIKNDSRKVSDFYTVKDVSGIGKGIEAHLDNGSWNLNLNEKSELDGWVGIRVYAVGVNEKISFPSEIAVKVSTDVPIIGGSEELYLVQRAGDSATGNITASRRYESGMWVTGKWFLTGSVEQSSGISELTITTNGTSTNYLVSNGMSSNSVEGKTWGTSPSQTRGYSMNYELGTGSGFGTLNLSIYAKASVTDVPKETTMSLIINYDNTKPALDIRSKPGFLVESEVQNSNGTYNLGGVVTENSIGSSVQSGFSRVAFYFTRKLGEKVYIYDPMIKTQSGGGILVNSNIVEKCGLLCKKVNITHTKSTPGTLTLPAADSHIRAGGIVMVGGTFYRINSVSGTTVTLLGQPLYSSQDETESLEVYFALAQIVDNPTAETFDSDGKNVLYDDGDGICESVRTTGTTTNWQANIDSQNIPDGSITIHIVAFDAAGNYSEDSVSGTVSNNAPRLAGVRIATDINGNGNVDDNEYISRWTALMDRFMFDANYKDYSLTITTDKNNISDKLSDVKKMGYTSNAKRNSSIVISSDTTENGDSALKVRADTWIYPTIVGGNESLQYNYKIFPQGSTNAEYSKPLTLLANNVASDTVTYNQAIELKLKDILTGSISDGTKKAVFTIWDKTEGLTQGTDSQCATVTMIFDLALSDNEAPVATINKFHWNSESDNSLYKNSKNYGHIELEDDWKNASGYNSSASRGEYDGDPKVSGKIVIDGTVTDNNKIDKLYFSFEGIVNEKILAAKYESGVFESEQPVSKDFADTSWMFEVTESNLTLEGHTVKYKLYIDTEKISGVADVDKNCTIYAEDAGTPKLSSGTIKYENAKSSVPQSYRMDIVPYITALHTEKRANSGLKDQNLRAASGKYSIIKGTDSSFITVNGFNLQPGKVRIVNESSLVGATYSSGVDVHFENGSTKNEFYCSNEISKSGYLEVFVNGVRSLNNINSNEAKGSYNKINDKIKDPQNMYNREPDYYKSQNLLLSDDRYLRVFEMHETPIKGGSYPVMMMDTDDKDKPVFAYLDGRGDTLHEGDANINISGTYYNEKLRACAISQRTRFNTDGTVDMAHAEILVTGNIFDQMAMARDDSGRYYHVTLHNLAEASAVFVYDRYSGLYEGWARGWGTTGGHTDVWTIHAYDKEGNARSIDPITADGLALPGRYKYPKIVTKGGSVDGDASVYIAYFDEGIGDIIFRQFKVGDNLSSGDNIYTPENEAIYYGSFKVNNISQWWTSQYKSSNGGHKNTAHSSGLVENYSEGNRNTSNQVLKNINKDLNGETYSQKTNIGYSTSDRPFNSYTDRTNNNSLITDKTGSKYFTLGVTSNNTVLIAWYEISNGKFHMKYATGVTGNDPTNASTKSKWTNASIGNIKSYMGAYVSMAVDSNDGIHMACLDETDSDLMYIYMSSYDAIPQVHRVDQVGSVGNWTQIKVLEKDGKVIPYIGYFNATELGQRESIKLAYLNEGFVSSAAASIPDGVDSDGYTTGAWEYMTVPAITPPEGANVAFQGVCLDFDSKNNPVVGYMASSIEFGKWLEE